MSQEPTAAEVGHSLAVFGNYRVLRTQQLAKEASPSYFPIPSVLMALGLRETGLENIDGGATLVNGRWVQAYTDRGCFQINETDAAKWLKSVPGCKEGQWSPEEEGHNALEPHYCPRFTDAAEYTIKEFSEHRTQALAAGVPEHEVERFCIAAHNAGFEGALQGFREGNVDKNTAHGNYSEWVLRYASVVHDWVVAHPGWVYTGQTLDISLENAQGDNPDMADPTPVVSPTTDPSIQTAITDVSTDVPAVVHDVETKNISGLISAGEGAYAQLAPLLPTIVQESKAGYKTTEFYLVIAYEALTQSGAVHLPGTWGKLIAGVTGLTAYVLSRGIAKSGVGNQVPSL